MNKKAWLVVGVMLAVVAAIPVAFAAMQGNSGNMGTNPPGVISSGIGPDSSATFENLYLGDYQTKKIAEFRTMYDRDTALLRAQIVGEQGKLETLLNERNPNPALVSPVVERLGYLNAKLTEQDVILAHEIRSVLTPEQIAKFDSQGGRLVYGVGPNQSLGNGYLCQFVPDSMGVGESPIAPSGETDLSSPDWNGYR